MTDIYRPSRLDRRRAAGSRCLLCPNRMHHRDVIAVVQDDRPPVYVHVECLSVATEMAEADATEEENVAPAPAAGAPDPGLDGSKDDYTSVASLHGGLEPSPYYTPDGYSEYDLRWDG